MTMINQMQFFNSNVYAEAKANIYAKIFRIGNAFLTYNMACKTE